jgi:ADP-heptose:LPS heptosyltransferase
VVSQLDLVISVDTGVVHLTGAPSAPAWVLLCYAPD